MNDENKEPDKKKEPKEETIDPSKERNSQSVKIQKMWDKKARKADDEARKKSESK